ncbi:TauD/TfdA family dioxygenase [Oceanicola sp. 22II-s10i]|uniref:TauD/TfdA family dioxygenase n=1 Tax=Oceanicola sp. 22II-s10i TaxID=1317116 RepID=UPI000B527C9C|nr:TauD/TfdA family dioxygenase [Oceanicola sp. 22II-s10i]
MSQFDLDTALLNGVLAGDAEDRARFAQDVTARIAADDFFVLPLARHCDGYESFKAACMAIAESLGQPMVQNEAGDRVIEVYDRNVGRIEDGARYHQTRQGGDIHTDSVNRPEPMRFLILACASPAFLGGESILIRGDEILAAMRRIPGVLETLSQPFFFEGRGMTAEPELFRMPVLSETTDGPSFRYLRPYIESAHRRAGQPVTPEQTYAFDVLDAHLELSELQHRVTLEQGDLLIADDTRVFHGRTSFIDGTIPGGWTSGRCMLRYWIE